MVGSYSWLALAARGLAECSASVVKCGVGRRVEVEVEVDMEQREEWMVFPCGVGEVWGEIECGEIGAEHPVGIMGITNPLVH